MDGRDIARILRQLGGYVDQEVAKFDKVSTLPMFGAGVEIKARRRAAEILSPVASALRVYAEEYESEQEYALSSQTPSQPWDYEI